ncbi:TPA: hypothetical protein DCX16_05860 [bacterium]|nr:hypothetical protein [bacterium]
MAIIPAILFGKGGGEDTGEFMKIGQGVKASAMGGAVVASVDGAEATYWNPAGLVNTKRRELLGIYTKHFEDIKLGFIGYAQPFSKDSAIGINVIFMNADGGEEVIGDKNGHQKTGKTLNVECRSFTFSYAKKQENLSIGCSIKSIHQDYAGYRGSSLAYDIGSTIDISPILLGLCISNIRGKQKIDNVENKVPFTIMAGVGYKYGDMLLFEIDVERRKGKKNILHLGCEYHLLPNIDIRGGYDSASGFSFGFGTRSQGRGVFKNIIAQIDYACLYNDELALSHRFSLLTRF